MYKLKKNNFKSSSLRDMYKVYLSVLAVRKYEKRKINITKGNTLEAYNIFALHWNTMECLTLS